MDEQAQARLAKLRERLFSHGRRKTKVVTFGEAEVTLRQLPALESARYIDPLQSDDHIERMNAIAKMIVVSVFDEDNNPVFSESDIPTILADMGPDGFGDIAGEVLTMNSASKKKLEEIAKNSEAPASGLLSD